MTKIDRKLFKLEAIRDDWFFQNYYDLMTHEQKQEVIKSQREAQRKGGKIIDIRQLKPVLC